MKRLFAYFSRQELYNRIPDDEVVSKQQFVLFRIFSYAGTLVCLGGALKMMLTIEHHGALPYFILLLSIVMMVNFHSVKDTSKLIRAYSIMLGATFILLHIVSYTCGGIRTGGTLYFPAVILFAFMLLGRKGGLLFCVLTILHVVYLYYISSYTNVTSFSFFKANDLLINQDYLTNAILTVFLIASQGNYLQSGKNVVIQRLTKSKKLLEDNYALLEEQNDLLNTYAHHLEKTNKELEKIASVASHDLKAPLRAIGNLTDIIEDESGHLFSEDTLQHFGIIKGRVKRMDNLLDALLEYSKADKNREEYGNFDLDSVVDHALESLTVAENVKIIRTTKLPIVFGEFNKLKKVIANILHNAIQFNDKSIPEIIIDVEEKANEWILSIKDNGPGIDEKYHEKIFVIFQTLARRDEKETMGTGLAVAKKIIEDSGGTIHVRSEEGSGAAFLFSIPKFAATANKSTLRKTAPTAAIFSEGIGRENAFSQS